MSNNVTRDVAYEMVDVTRREKLLKVPFNDTY